MNNPNQTAQQSCVFSTHNIAAACSHICLVSFTFPCTSLKTSEWQDRNILISRPGKWLWLHSSLLKVFVLGTQPCPKPASQHTDFCGAHQPLLSPALSSSAKAVFLCVFQSCRHQLLSSVYRKLLESYVSLCLAWFVLFILNLLESHVHSLSSVHTHGNCR